MDTAAQWIWARFTGSYSRRAGQSSERRAAGFVSAQQLLVAPPAEATARRSLPSEHVEDGDGEEQRDPRSAPFKARRVSDAPNLRRATPLERALLWLDLRLRVVDSLALVALFLVLLLVYCVFVYVARVHRAFQD